MDERLVLNQLGIGLAHQPGDLLDELPHDRLVDAEPPGVSHQPAEHPPQDVSSALVRRQDPVRDEERAGPPSGPYSGPRSTKISEQGPQGPAVCVHQKLAGSPCGSNLPLRTIRSGARPTSSTHSWAASSSDSNTVTQRRSWSIPYRPVTS